MPDIRKLIQSFLLCLIILPVGRAQDVERSLLEDAHILEKFGRIEEETLSAQSASHSYPYEYLLNEASVRFDERSEGIVAVIDYLVRIKVYSDDPLEITEASLVGIPFYFQNNIEKVINLEGITHAPDGSKTVLNEGEVRTMDLNSRYKTLEFEMPDAKEGSVLEYKYTVERRYIEELPDFYFSHRVPTKQAILFLKNETFLRYETVTQNADFEISYHEEKKDTSSIPLVFTYQRPEPVFTQKWSAEEIPPAEESTYISSVDDMRGKIKFQLSEFGLPRQPLENSWDYVAAHLLRSNNPYQIIDDYSELKQTGGDIASQTESLIEAQDSVYRFVNSKVEFNETGAVFPENGLDHVLEGEPANQAEINLVLLALLRGAGIDAKPLYISGRNYGSIDKAFPSLYQFNRVLIYSKIEGQEFFMDASYANSIPDLIPVDAYSRQGMILSENGYTWVEIVPDKSIFHLEILLNAALQENGDLTGTIEAETRGYPSQQIRKDLSAGDSSNEIVKKTFFEVYPDLEVSDGVVKVNKDPDLIQVAASFTIPEYAVTFTEGMEFRPMVVGYLFSNPFEPTERKTPVTLDAPEALSIQYNIELPGGYSIQESGESRSTSLTGAELKETYEAGRNKISYSFDVLINRKEFPATAYSDLRQIYERWVSLSNGNWYIEKN